MAAPEIITVPEGFPVYCAASDRFLEVRDGHGVKSGNKLYCTERDAENAKRAEGRA